MRPVTDEKASNVPKKQFIIAGAVAGAIAAVINNIYHLTYSAITGFTAKEAVNIFTVSLASIVPLIIAGYVYYLLARYTSKGTTYFIVLSVLLTMFTERLRVFAIFFYQYDVPVEFYSMIIPMNFIAGAIAAAVIPLYVIKIGKKQQVNA
ncbi:MAG: hypothetical protein ACLFT3_02705 [Cyclobacteriaceae bacterium]